MKSKYERLQFYMNGTALGQQLASASARAIEETEHGEKCQKHHINKIVYGCCNHDHDSQVHFPLYRFIAKDGDKFSS